MWLDSLPKIQTMSSIVISHFTAAKFWAYFTGDIESLRSRRTIKSARFCVSRPDDVAAKIISFERNCLIGGNEARSNGAVQSFQSVYGKLANGNGIEYRNPEINGKPIDNRTISINSSHYIQMMNNSWTSPNGPCLFAKDSSGMIHVTVGNRNNRRSGMPIKAHLFEGDLPKDAILKLDEGLYVSSPELTLIQTAQEFGRTGTMLLAMQMCGTYSLSQDDNRRCIKRGQLANPASIRNFAIRMNSRKGRNTVLEISPYLSGGSASPMESIVEMLLCLPKQRGGYHFPIPKMNEKFHLSESSTKSMGVGILRCDLSWPSCNVGVEYNSDQEHSTARAFSRDTHRMNAMQESGMQIITITKDDIFNLVKFDSAARQIAKAMGRQVNKHFSPDISKRNQLWREILEYERMISG